MTARPGNGPPFAQRPMTTKRENSKTGVAAEDPAGWLDDHGAILFQFAFGRLKNRELAEDLVQETMLSAVRSLSSFRADSSIRTWLIGILKNKIIDHLRQTRRAAALGIADADGFEETVLQRDFNRYGIWNRFLSNWAANPEELLEHDQLLAIFKECLEGLPEKARQAYLLKNFDAQESDEICNILGITTSHLWVLLHRARHGLRDCIEKRWSPIEDE